LFDGLLQLSPAARLSTVQQHLPNCHAIEPKCKLVRFR
jgi:hypothetical protein